MTRMKPQDTPKPIAKTMADWLGPIDREMRQLLAAREADPEWQRRARLERAKERKAQLEQWLTIIEGCARGNYGPKARNIAEKAGGQDPELSLREAVRQIRVLWDSGSAERSQTCDPVKRVELGWDDFKHTHRLQAWLEESDGPSQAPDNADDFDRSL